MIRALVLSSCVLIAACGDDSDSPGIDGGRFVDAAGTDSGGGVPTCAGATGREPVGFGSEPPFDAVMGTITDLSPSSLTVARTTGGAVTFTVVAAEIDLNDRFAVNEEVRVERTRDETPDPSGLVSMVVTDRVESLTDIVLSVDAENVIAFAEPGAGNLAIGDVACADRQSRSTTCGDEQVTSSRHALTVASVAGSLMVAPDSAMTSASGWTYVNLSATRTESTGATDGAGCTVEGTTGSAFAAEMAGPVE